MKIRCRSTDLWQITRVCDLPCLDNSRATGACTFCRDHYTPKDSEGIPTGDIEPVRGTAFDFQESETVGKRIHQVEGGYDHNYVLFRRGKDVKSEVEGQQGPKK